MITEPSEAEIAEWWEKYNDTEMRNRLLEFEKEVYELFESLRKKTGLRLIRGILRRGEIKSFDSILEKISDRRIQQQEKIERGELPSDTNPYVYDQVEDLVGIKVLCPYSANADEVADHIFTKFLPEGKFRVVEPHKAAGYVKKDGYTGYHFTAYPPLSHKHGWARLYCEVQIKTLLEEAWDAKTHDHVYKMKGIISSDLVKQFDILANSLAIVEQQSEIFREEVEEIPIIEERQKKMTALAFFVPEIEAYVRENSLPSLSRDLDPLAPEDLGVWNEFIRGKGDAITTELCIASALIAIKQGDPEQVSAAMTVARKYLENTSEGLKSARECNVALMHWSLSRYRTAIGHAYKAIEMAESDRPTKGSLDRIYWNYCYIVADATLFGHRVPQKHLTRTLELAEELEKSRVRNLRHLDTFGWVLIRLGSEIEQVDKGVKLCQDAWSKAKGESTETGRLFEAFCRRHIRLGRLKLAEMERSLRGAG